MHLRIVMAPVFSLNQLFFWPVHFSDASAAYVVLSVTNATANNSHAMGNKSCQLSPVTVLEHAVF